MSSPSLAVSSAVTDNLCLHNPAALEIMAGINASSTKLELDEFTKRVFQAYELQKIDADEYTLLVNRAYVRRRRTAAPGGSCRAANGGRVWSRFPARRRQRSPDRQKSRERRRTLGGSSALPPSLRAQYTEGHRAVLCIVALEIQKSGHCDFAIAKIAALAGVCRTTVHNALIEAKRLAHVSVEVRPRLGEKHQTNIIRIVSAEWRTWVLRGLSCLGGIGSNLSNPVSPSRNKDSLEGRFGQTYAQGAHGNALGNKPKNPSLIGTWSPGHGLLVLRSVGVGCRT